MTVVISEAEVLQNHAACSTAQPATPGWPRYLAAASIAFALVAAWVGLCAV